MVVVVSWSVGISQRDRYSYGPKKEEGEGEGVQTPQDSQKENTAT